MEIKSLTLTTTVTIHNAVPTRQQTDKIVRLIEEIEAMFPESSAEEKQ